jgi:hypothetical protein
MKTIDIIIPTMWFVESFVESIEKYLTYDCVSKVIIIDNNKSRRPSDSILTNSKIKIISHNRNIYVNPAWNEGVSCSTADIVCIANDDINIEESVFLMVLDHNLKQGELIGVNLQGRHNNYKIDDHINTKEKIVSIDYNRSKPIGSQAWAFGICMFMKRDSYKTIPSLYQVWFGDDYLAQQSSSVYAIQSDRIKGTISETLKRYDETSEIHKRLILDCKNLLRFNHFKNGSNWDIPLNMIKNETSQQSRLAAEYELARKIPSDINENISILYDLAKTCKHITEMGVRTGVSTRAFLYTSFEKLVSYDILFNKEVDLLFKHARSIGKDASYINADVLKIEIEETDLLFIDTYHTYDQLKKELMLHGNKSKKYIIFHDTYTFGLVGENKKDQKGLISAIIEFTIDNPQWKFKIYKTNNNGLTVLERT